MKIKMAICLDHSKFQKRISNKIKSYLSKIGVKELTLEEYKRSKLDLVLTLTSLPRNRRASIFNLGSQADLSALTVEERCNILKAMSLVKNDPHFSNLRADDILSLVVKNMSKLNTNIFLAADFFFWKKLFSPDEIYFNLSFSKKSDHLLETLASKTRAPPSLIQGENDNYLIGCYGRYFTLHSCGKHALLWHSSCSQEYKEYYNKFREVSVPTIHEVALLIKGLEVLSSQYQEIDIYLTSEIIFDKDEIGEILVQSILRLLEYDHIRAFFPSDPVSTVWNCFLVDSYREMTAPFYKIAFENKIPPYDNRPLHYINSPPLYQSVYEKDIYSRVSYLVGRYGMKENEYQTTHFILNQMGEDDRVSLANLIVQFEMKSYLLESNEKSYFEKYYSLPYPPGWRDIYSSKFFDEEEGYGFGFLLKRVDNYFFS